ncbi:MAG: hypothetical protein LBI26_03100 [Holosporales bacterium]|jgi:hypothetical protein|nr:hypothetical protein [Holosporales bacterium]
MKRCFVACILFIEYSHAMVRGGLGVAFGGISAQCTQSIQLTSGSGYMGPTFEQCSVKDLSVRPKFRENVEKAKKAIKKIKDKESLLGATKVLDEVKEARRKNENNSAEVDMLEYEFMNLCEELWKKCKHKKNKLKSVNFLEMPGYEGLSIAVGNISSFVKK